MPLIHGEDISAQQVEREISSWDAERFARLCNGLAWAVAWPAAQALPAFTERVLVADNGIDAEWSGDIMPGMMIAEHILRTGTNVFQFKKREVTEKSRADIVSTLASSLRGALADVERRTGMLLASYVLFTNVDLTPAQQGRIKQAILHGVGSRQVPVEVVGAAGLAAMLNNLPHLRSAFFATLDYQTWGQSWEAHRRASPFAKTPLVARQGAVEALTTLLSDPRVRVVALTGAHMMGKSRVALEATRSRDVGFVEALERHGPGVSDLMRLSSPSRTVIVLVNDPDPDTARDLAQGVLATDGLKLLLCLSIEDCAPRPSFGLDERVRLLSLPPLSDDDSRNLLKEANAKLDYSIESWVINNAGGVPGVVLAAAHLGPRLRSDGSAFLQQIATEFERDLQARLSPPELQVMRAIALLSHLGVRGPARSEAETVCSCFGLDYNLVLNALERLAATGFVRIEGSYAEVIPPPLANWLAARFILGRSDQLAACFAAFGDAARRRLLRRLAQVTGDEASAFWNDLFGAGGPFTSLNGIICNSELFYFAAAVNARRTAALLLEELKKNSVDDRRLINGDARRNLIYAIEGILLSDASSDDAFWCMALLAEAENEQWSNNASGILKEVFAPLHPQVPLPLERRLAVLADMISPRSSSAISILAADAIGDMLQFSSATMLRQSISAAPLGRTPSMLWSDVWDYAGKALDLLAGASKDTRPEVRQRACSRLPSGAAMLISRLHPAGMPLLRTLVGRVLDGDRDINVAALADSIRWCRFALRDKVHGASEANAAIVEELTCLHDKLYHADFDTRLRLWLGGWYQDIEAPSTSIDVGDQAIRGLAQEAAGKPALLDDETVRWLVEKAERGQSFWFELGRSDSTGGIRPVVARLAEDDNSAYAFAVYLAGWGKEDAQSAAQFFQDRSQRDGVVAQAILYGTLEVDTPSVAADRIVQLLEGGRIAASRVADAIMRSRWQRNVAEEKLAEVLEALAAPDLEGGANVLRILDCRSYTVPWNTGALSDLAWRCLEVHPPLQSQDDSRFNRVAGKLARQDSERAFRLLDRCLTDDRSGRRWNPISDALLQNDFWKTIAELDRARALRAVLEAARLRTPNSHSALFHLPNLINMTADAPELLAYARQSEEHGLIACQAIVGGQEAFWPIAFSLVELFPRSRVENELTLRVEQMGQVISGPYSEHYRRCIQEIEAAIALPAKPVRASAWLDALKLRFESALQEQLRREADDRVDRG